MASASNVQILPSSSSDLSSHISESPWEYEVFLSFRGEDTRYTFTERLYDALVERGIVTFKDDQELEIAKPISPELICAIKKSRMAVVVLSRNYASSTWCLQELVEIVECVKERGMKIFPIFYHVDPSNVRHQRETFADAFVEHDKRFKENIEKVRAWRGALTKVANHSGYSLKDGSESKHIQTIVGKISCELDGTLSGVDKDNLVGMDSLDEKMLAQSVFKRIRSQFQASSFLDNVRMEHEKHGSATLQQQLIDMKLKSEKDKAYVCNNIMAIKILLKCSYTFSTLIHCSCLSNELHLMEWYEYPLRSIPRGFQPVKLVELIMPRSRFERLPMRFTNLKRLKLLDLSDSRNLILTPDFTGFPNLEKLILQGCTRLEKVDPSVGALERLILLNLRDCKCLSSFPHEINLKSLEILILSGCSRLKNFPEIGQNMIYLSKLYLDGTAIEELPSSIEHLTNLALLNLRDCKSFLSFPRVLFGLASLKSLILSGCRCQPTKSGHPLGLSPILSPIDVRLNFVQLISFSVLYYLILPNTYLRILTCVALILWTHFLCVARQHESKLINLLLPRSFSGLSSVVSLDLSDCNLLDGAFPDDLSCLSSLQSLNLSRNVFICLPNCISQLSKLKFLCLDNCTKLKSLQNLPVSTQLVMARECSSLENYSGQVVVWTSGEAGFTFINCLSLADDEECKVGEVFLLDSQVRPLWQRYMEEKIHQSQGLQSILPQTEIPKWFIHQKYGSSVLIRIPSDLYGNSSWKGIVLCAIFVVHKDLISNISPSQDPYFHKFRLRLDMDGGLADCPQVFNVPKDRFHAGSFGLWLYLSHERFRDNLDERNCISPSITTHSPDVEIKACGARILYDTDMAEFVQNLSENNFRISEDLLHQGNENSWNFI